VRSGSIIAVTGTAPLGSDGKMEKRSREAILPLKRGDVWKLSNQRLKGSAANFRT